MVALPSNLRLDNICGLPLSLAISACLSVSVPAILPYLEHRFDEGGYHEFSQRYFGN